MYLQLADKGDQWLDSLAENGDSPQDLYIFVPDDPSGRSGKWVREDFFDNLSPLEWESVMDELEPFQPQAQLSGVFSNWKEKRAARKEDRSIKKGEKTRRKEERHASKMAGRSTRQQRRLMKGGESGEGGERGMEIFRGVTDTIGGIFGGGGGQQQRGFEGGFGFEPEKSWMAKNWPILVVGGVVVIGGIALATRKKKT